MKGMDIYKSLGHISEGMVQEAEETTGKLYSHKWNWKHFTAIASSLALIFGLSLFLFQNGGSDGGMTGGGMSGSSGSGAIPEDEEKKDYSLYFNEIDGQVAVDRAMPEGYFINELGSVEISKAFLSLENLTNITDLSGTVSYSSKDEVATFYEGNLDFSMGEETKVDLIFAVDEVIMCYILVGDEKQSEIEGVPVTAGKMGSKSHGFVYYAEFMLDNIAYRVEMSTSENGEKMFTELVAQIILGGKTDISLFEVPPEEIPFLKDEKLTQSEVFSEVDFGRYMPDFSPVLQFESGGRVVNQWGNYLSSYWTFGNSYTGIFVRNMEAEDENRFVSAENTHHYDMSLYPSPQAETVPHEFRDKVDNPIFLAEELTLEMVKMRETEKEWIRFAILYADVLVEINASGVSGEDVWEIIKDLPQEN